MRRLMLACLLAVSVACGSKKPDPVGPVSGDLTVSYVGPSQTDGALLLLVNGAVTAVKATGGYQIASAAAGQQRSGCRIGAGNVASDGFCDALAVQPAEQDRDGARIVA